MKSTKLDYFDGKELMPANSLRIGASGIGKYFTKTAKFFKELVHGVPGDDMQAYALGTVVHYCLECYIKNEPVDVSEIDQYVRNQQQTIPDLDVQHINNQYSTMAYVAQQYLATLDLSGAVAERFITTEVRPGIYIGGSIDLLTRNIDGTWTINDYKTLAANSVSKMTYDYEMQLLTYGKVLQDLGERVSMIRTINITTNKVGRVNDKGKPLPDQPSKVIIHEKVITPEDWEKVSATFDVAAEAVETYIAEPRLRGILAQDNRCKLLPCSYTPFIDTEEI